MRVKDFADHDPLAFDLQEMEKISEAETGNIVGVNAGAGGSPDDLDADDSALSFRRRTEVFVDAVEQILDCTACELSVSSDAEHGRLIAEGRLHDAAIGLLAAIDVLVQHLGNGLVFLNVGWFGQVLPPG